MEGIDIARHDDVLKRMVIAPTYFANRVPARKPWPRAVERFSEWMIILLVGPQTSDSITQSTQASLQCLLNLSSKLIPVESVHPQC